MANVCRSRMAKFGEKGEKKIESDETKIICYNCNKPGHIAKNFSENRKN